MAQLQKVAAVTNDSQTVTIAGDVTSQARRNFIFMVVGELVPYVLAVDSTFNGTSTVLTLTGAYAGVTNATANTVIATGYTYPDNIPTLTQGDVGTAAVFTAAMHRVQEMVTAVAPEGVQEVIDSAAQVAADRVVVAADKATVAADKAIVAADKATVAADKAIVATNKAATDTSATNAANQVTLAAAQVALATTQKTLAEAAATTATNQATVAVNASAAASGYSTNAGTKSTEADASASAAAASAATANTKKVEAEAAAAAASGSAATATTQAGISTTQATAAAASETAAVAAKNLAQSWAEAAEDAPVVTGQYSAKHWALKAQQAAVGGLIFRGNWSAASGTYPTPVRSGAGDMWRVSVAGTVSSVAYDVGDAIIYDGAGGWIKQDNTEQVTSVAGRIGAVTLTKADVGLSNVDNTTDLAKPISTAVQTALNAKLNLTGGEVAGSLSTTGSMTSAEGFYTTSYVSGRNAIWRFLNAQDYGLSYFQGAGGYGGNDSIGFHFGTPTVAGSSVNIQQRGIVTKNLEVTSGADTWFQMGADTTAASYGSFRKGGTNTSVGLIGTDGGGAIGGGLGDKFVIRSMLGDLVLYSDNGQVTSNSSLSISGNMSAGGNLTVSGASSFGGMTAFGAGLKLTGAATLTATAAKEWSYEHPVTRYYFGDGTGYSFALSKRVGGATTDMLTLTDAGNLSVTGSGTFGGNVTIPNAYYLAGRNAANTLSLPLIGRSPSDGVVIDPDGYGTSVGSNFSATGSGTFGGMGSFTASTIGLLLRQSSSAGYTGMRIFNDLNTSSRCLEIDYAGSAYAGALLSGGPTGESASITTTGAYPLVLGTNNTARVILDTSGNLSATGNILAGGVASPELGAGYGNIQIGGASGAIVQVQTASGASRMAMSADDSYGYLGSRTNHAVKLTVNNSEVGYFTTGLFSYAGTVSSGDGFQTTTYTSAARNRIWSFGNSDQHGLSYFQGSAGYEGSDSIGFHFGVATTGASTLNVLNNERGIAVAGHVFVRMHESLNATHRGLKFGIINNDNDYGGVTMTMNSGEVRYTAGFSGWGGYHTWYANGAQRMTLDESANLLVGRTTNPKGAKLAIEGDLAVHGGNTRTTGKYSGTSGIGSTNTWATAANLAALQTGSGHFAMKIRCYGTENGTANASYSEWLVVYGTNGSYGGAPDWKIALVCKVASGNPHADMTLRIPGGTANLEIQNGAGAGGAGSYYMVFDILEPN